MSEQTSSGESAAVMSPGETATMAAPTRSLGGVSIVGTLGILGGVLLILVGVIAWIGVTNQLMAENITIPDDAAAFQGQQVAGPVTAFIQADVINKHALNASGGKTYAELDQDDPVRATVMQASFLRASLFTSVVAYGVALFAVGMGVLAILFGWALRRVASAPVVIKQSRVV